MESAIPQHLRCPRTRQARASEDYNPPYPAWVARMKSDVAQMAMAYFGVQYRGDAGRAVAHDGLHRLAVYAVGRDAPGHHDLAHWVDEEGYDTLIWIAYWNDTASLDRWLQAPALAAWWASDDRLSDGVGWFREIACPRVDRFETLFSTPDRFEGAATLAEGLSGEIREHGYWGGMRDRLPISQVDGLRNTQPPRRLPAAGARVRVHAPDNLALIRSGQEWTDTDGREREIYLKEVEPVFREGMDFLRDSGASVGCMTNRYMTHLDSHFRPLDKTFGLSWWQSLEHMERWAESHPTHVAIFGNFMRMVQAMNFQLKLRLYHEVSVLRAQDQVFEYVNCHPRTGLLRTANPG
jgi:aldoxime dehydratase